MQNVLNTIAWRQCNILLFVSNATFNVYASVVEREKNLRKTNKMTTLTDAHDNELSNL